MRRLRAWLSSRRKPQASVPVPVSVEISWNCAPGNNDEQFIEYLKRYIRRGGGGTRVLK